MNPITNCQHHLCVLWKPLRSSWAFIPLVCNQHLLIRNATNSPEAHTHTHTLPEINVPAQSRGLKLRHHEPVTDTLHHPDRQPRQTPDTYLPNWRRCKCLWFSAETRWRMETWSRNKVGKHLTDCYRVSAAFTKFRFTLFQTSGGGCFKFCLRKLSFLKVGFISLRQDAEHREDRLMFCLVQAGPANITYQQKKKKSRVEPVQTTRLSKSLNSLWILLLITSFLWQLCFLICTGS